MEKILQKIAEHYEPTFQRNRNLKDRLVSQRSKADFRFCEIIVYVTFNYEDEEE